MCMYLYIMLYVILYFFWALPFVQTFCKTKIPGIEAEERKKSMNTHYKWVKEMDFSLERTVNFSLLIDKAFLISI